MSAPGAISIAFDLPFRAELVLGPQNQPFVITIKCGAGAPGQSGAVLIGHTSSFVEAAMFGMGAGALVKPRFHHSLDVEHVLTVQDQFDQARIVSFSIVGLTVDPTYINVLLHKLYALAADGIPIEAVCVVVPFGAGESHPVEIRCARQSDLPRLSPEAAFVLESYLNAYASSRTLQVEFESQPTPHEEAIFNRARQVWAAQCIEGGYISESFGVSAYCLIPGRYVQVGCTIEWVLEKADIDLRAFDAFGNFLTAFSASCVPVARFSIV